MRILVVIPTYNEADNIRFVVDAVLREASDVDVLIVDDSSPDGTADLVTSHLEHEHRVFLLSRPGKAGLGAAYRAGFGWAQHHGYDVIVQMDADLSHPPAKVPELIDALTYADVAIGSRYVEGGGVANWSVRRRFISAAGNAYVRFVLRLRVRDATAGFRAFRSSALMRLGALESESNGYCFQIENTWRAARIGLRTTEVPITFTDRTNGESKMSADIVREALLRVLLWRWEEIRHPSRTPAAIPTSFAGTRA